MTIDYSRQLANAREAISKGDTKTAQQVLASLLNQDSQNIEAWLLLSDILENPQQRIDCLNRVLRLDQNNEIAKIKLEDLTKTKNSATEEKRENLNKLLGRNIVIIGIALVFIGAILTAGIFALGTIYPNSSVGTNEFYLYFLIFSCALIACGVITAIVGWIMSHNQNQRAKQQAKKSTSLPTAPLIEKTMEQRREILQQYIYAYIQQGYRVVSQTDTTAQMIKPKQFSLLAAIFWLFVFVIGLLIYIFYFMASGDQQMYLEVDLYGQVKTVAT